MARTRINHTGERYGRLVVETFHHQGVRRESYWLCRCDCGETHIVAWGNLRSGDVKSCGCLHDEVAGAARRRHGMTDSRTYKIWKAMRRRCRNPSNANWTRYGGRGIRVCDRWAIFENFLTDMGDCPSQDHSIDRVNNDGHYEPGNCRWATRHMQSRNRRDNRLLKVDGQVLTITDCAALFGRATKTIRDRLSRGVSVDVAVKSQHPVLTAPQGRPPRLKSNPSALERA